LKSDFCERCGEDLRECTRELVSKRQVVEVPPISEGSIENLLNKSAQKATPIYDHILELIKEATYVGSEETGAFLREFFWHV